MVDDLRRKLENIYSRVPGVPCIAGCTGCCVSPTVTLAEFIVLMAGMTSTWSPAEADAVIASPARPHPGFAGNLYCRFQGPNGFCRIHPVRALACRLHGLPVIEKLGVSNLENCTIMEKSLLPDVPVEEIRGWLDELIDINRALIPDYGEDFSCLLGLNLESWLDILFADSLSLPEPREYQALMRTGIPRLPPIPGYREQTGIIQKLSDIALLKISIDFGDSTAVRGLLNKIRDKYPATGSFFHEQVQTLMTRLDQSPSG